MSKITFTLTHYLALMAFLFSAWGIGISLVKRGFNQTSKSNELLNSVSLVLGIGVFIFGLLLLGIAGQFTKNYIIGLLLIGNLLALKNLLPSLQLSKIKMLFERRRRLSLERKLLLLPIIIISLPMLINPLRPPLSWDELMYHLPHAKQWAQTGHLIVNTWIRYPWFPYNYELLYAASIILFDDVMPHLLHSLAGWLTALMIFKLASKYFNFLTATIATIIWLVVSKSHYSNAYIDLGVTMFIFAAFITFYLWLESRENNNLLIISAFLMGIAIGTKYQALMFLPFFGVILLHTERKKSNVLLAILFLAIPCIYWYARNYLQTGDPVNPVGGKLFGFSDWNSGDFEYQFRAFTPEKRGWPSWILIPAILAILTRELRSNLIAKYLLAFGLSSTLIWLYVSHYPRYLLPAQPVLAILAATGWIYIFAKINFFNVLIGNKSFKIFAISTILLLLSIDSSLKIISGIKYIAPSNQSREAILSKRVSGYKTITYSNINYLGKTYQFGLEDSIYYFNTEVWGDHFGPGRYRDFSNLTSKGLYDKLRFLKFENLIINEEKWPDITMKDNFSCFFTLVYQENTVKENKRNVRIGLYRINQKSYCR